VRSSHYLIYFRSCRKKGVGLDERRTEFGISTGVIAVLAVIFISALVAGGCIPTGAATDAIAKLGAKALGL
jgi:hypothetical protein